MWPKAIVLDLDYTIWPCWCDTHLSLPLSKALKTGIEDGRGFKLYLYDDVSSIVKLLSNSGVILIAASRTARPDIAEKLLTLFHIDDKPLISFFRSLQWGQGSKINHVEKAACELHIEEELRRGDVILFDDEARNRDVEEVNCYFFKINQNEGLTFPVFNEALEVWRKSRFGCL